MMRLPNNPAKLSAPVLLKTDRNGTEHYEAERHCVRCGGYGSLLPWGTCYRCGGSGIDPKPERYVKRPDDVQRKLDERKRRETERHEEAMRRDFEAMEPLESLKLKWTPNSLAFWEALSGVRYKVVKETEKALLLELSRVPESRTEEWIPKSCLDR